MGQETPPGPPLSDARLLAAPEAFPATPSEDIAKAADTTSVPIFPMTIPLTSRMVALPKLAKPFDVAVCRRPRSELVDFVEATREALKSHGVAALVVDDLSGRDLERIAWSGSRRHVEAVGEVLNRAASGQAEYLAIRAPDGTPVAIGAVDYTWAGGVGTIFQLSTHEQLRDLGLGTLLISAAEARIRRRGAGVARLGVEDDNPRARALYERLGYRVAGRRAASWEAERDDGTLFLYETMVTELDKALGRDDQARAQEGERP